MPLQARIPVALAAVYNFIWEHKPKEEEENDNDPDDLQPIGGYWQLQQYQMSKAHQHVRIQSKSWELSLLTTYAKEGLDLRRLVNIVDNMRFMLEKN